MQIWHYNPDTKELLGGGVADPCPVEEGAWLLPAFSTSAAPPELQAGQAAVFSGSGWSIVPDHRGETWWTADAKDNTAPHIVTAIGDPTGFDPPLTNVEPPAPPAVTRPIVVSPRQIRQALSQLGLRLTVETWVQAADQDIKDNWQYAADFVQGRSLVDTALEDAGTVPGDIALVFEVAKTL